MINFKIVFFVSILFLVIPFLCGCADKDNDTAANDSAQKTEGYIVTTSTGAYFLVFNNTPHGLFSIPRTAELFKNIVTTGDKVSVVIDSIEHTDPPSAGIRSLTIIEQGELSTLPDDVLDVVIKTRRHGLYY